MSKQGVSANVKAQMIIWALFMPVCLVVAIWAFWPDASKDDDISLYSTAAEGQEALTAPIGHLNLPGKEPAKAEATEEVAAAPAAAPTPQETYDSICAACHATGLLDSPKFGDKAAWDKRIADNGGFDGMVASAIAGKGAMPPKGGAGIDDEAFAKVVEYLSGQH